MLCLPQAGCSGEGEYKASLRGDQGSRIFAKRSQQATSAEPLPQLLLPHLLVLLTVSQAQPPHKPLSGILGQSPGDPRGREEMNASSPQTRPYCEQATGVALSVCRWRTANTKGVSPRSKPSFKADLGFSVQAIEIVSEEASGKMEGKSCPVI